MVVLWSGTHWIQSKMDQAPTTILNRIQYLMQACCQMHGKPWWCLSRAHMQGNIQCTYFLIHPWSKNLLWILLEWVEGTCTVMLLHSNLETWVLSSEQLALLNAGQYVRGVCIRIQERIAVSARNWCSGTHWFRTTNGPPVLTLWFSISVKVMVWSGLWAPCLELLNAAFPFRFERDVTEQDLQFSEVQSWARQS